MQMEFQNRVPGWRYFFKFTSIALAYEHLKTTSFAYCHDYSGALALNTAPEASPPIKERVIAPFFYRYFSSYSS